VEIIKSGVQKRVAEADKLVVQYEQKKANAEQEVTKHEEQLKSLQQQNEEAKGGWVRGSRPCMLPRVWAS
jgi:outer membrane protein TolC